MPNYTNGTPPTARGAEPVRLLLKPKEAAVALGVCERTLAELTARGELHPIRLPGRGKQARALHYAVSDLQRWIDATMAKEGCAS